MKEVVIAQDHYYVLGPMVTVVDTPVATRGHCRWGTAAGENERLSEWGFLTWKIPDSELIEPPNGSFGHEESLVLAVKIISVISKGM